MQSQPEYTNLSTCGEMTHTSELQNISYVEVATAIVNLYQIMYLRLIRYQ